MTQQTLAERATLSVEAIGALERGTRTRPYRETVALLGRALVLSPEREALLASAIGVAHPLRQSERSEALSASLLQLVRPDAQTSPKHNLPRQRASFVGRQHELGEIAALLREHRLVTVVGSGGVGKTRIAVQLGSGALGEFPDGVWLVDLAPLTEQSLVASAVLGALRLPCPTGSALEVVVSYCRPRRILMILDNCEHVIARARELAASLVELCPGVRILSTSREAMGVAGESVYRLPSLAVPPDSHLHARDIRTYEAVALFVDRALTADEAFALTDDNAADVAEICRRLDGIPLAIELTAARVKVLAPRQIARRLDQRFRLLTGRDSRALPRHRTMSASMDWSYDLLSPREQMFLATLSVFSGGCTLDAATAVCASVGEDDVDVVDLVASLVTKSLLVAESACSEQRYRLLESARQYARDKLVAQGEHERVARRHALTYLTLAEHVEHSWDTIPERAWLPHAKVELENWRTALEWTLVKRGDVGAGQRLAALRKVMYLSFGQAEARRWIRAALDLVDERTPPSLVARLEHADADFAYQSCDQKASLPAAERALMRYRDLGDKLGTAQAQNLVGGSLAIVGKAADAEPLLLEALEAAQTLGDRRLAASALQRLGIARSRAGDFAGARAYYTEALALAKILGAEFLATSTAGMLADNESDAGNPETALRLMLGVLATCRDLNYSTEPRIVTTLASIAMYLVVLGRYDEARARASEALEIARGIRLDVLTALSLRYLALAIMLRPQTEIPGTLREHAGIARLFGFIDARLTTLGIPEAFCLPQEYDRALALLRDAIGADELTRLTTTGAMMTEDEAIGQAHAIH